MKVYLREEGDYEQAHIVAVYPSLEIAKAAVVSEARIEGDWEDRGDGWWEYGYTHGSGAGRCREVLALVMEYEVEETDGLRFHVAWTYDSSVDAKHPGDRPRAT